MHCLHVVFDVTMIMIATTEKTIREMGSCARWWWDDDEVQEPPVSIALGACVRACLFAYEEEREHSLRRMNKQCLPQMYTLLLPLNSLHQTDSVEQKENKKFRAKEIRRRLLCEKKR